MRFITLTARRADTCRRCHGAIHPGQKIRWAKGPKGSMSYHLSKDCPAGQPAPAASARYSRPAEPDNVDDAPPAPAPRHRADDSVPAEPHFGRCHDGRGGRCEDYPCCGCDGLHGRDAYLPAEPPDAREDDWWRWEG